ncbi:MAG: LysR family transcriptional regulator [Myxococcota bacterium]
MDRDVLAHLPVVAAVAREGGFSAAAAVLGMSPSAVSHAVRAVEERLGEPVFARTTRSVRLTEAGAQLMSSLGPALEDIERALDAFRARQGQVTGRLRLNAARVSASLALTPILVELGRQHPHLCVELHTDEALIDIVDAGFDAGLRLGSSVQQDMVAVRLTPPFRTSIVASPRYLEARGAPITLADLQRHNCVGYRLVGSRRLYAWELLDAAGKDVTVAVEGTAVVTDATYALELALAGVGLAYVFEPLARSALEEGQLVEVLPEAAVEEDGLFVYYPRRASAAPKLRALIDAGRSLLARNPSRTRRTDLPARR